MNAHPALQLPTEDYFKIRKHLLPRHSRLEEAVFAFARNESNRLLSVSEWQAIQPSGFLHRSDFFLELTDDTRAAIIKRAHDLNASLIEFHSHPFQSVAQFSISDCEGFREFVPHVRWRLKNRPYAAVVIAEDSFDSLAWFNDFDDPEPLEIRLDDGRQLLPTSRTKQSWEATSHVW